MAEQLRGSPGSEEAEPSELSTATTSHGDFLVGKARPRRSQYVLTGLQSGQPKHLLLVDPEGEW